MYIAWLATGVYYHEFYYAEQFLKVSKQHKRHDYFTNLFVPTFYHYRHWLYVLNMKAVYSVATIQLHWRDAVDIKHRTLNFTPPPLGST